METVEQLLIEAASAAERSWFIRSWQVTDRTNNTATIRFEIDTDFYVQVFLSERSSRLSLALIGVTGRLYGRDRERGNWHRHPFGSSDYHQATHEGMSSRPVMQCNSWRKSRTFCCPTISSDY